MKQAADLIGVTKTACFKEPVLIAVKKLKKAIDMVTRTVFNNDKISRIYKILMEMRRLKILVLYITMTT